MNELNELSNYSQFKIELDRQMSGVAEGFVRIGYLLKLAKETNILKESGYANVNDFAKAEYNIDKTMVSRFISINDRFSEGGNSPQLKTEFKGFGYSKLVLMLQLPDTLNEELTPEYTKSEIQDIKNELDNENKISDLEVWAEERENTEYTELEQIILKISKDNPETYRRLHEAITTYVGIGTDNVMKLLAPSGEMLYSIRISGKGRIAVTINQTDSYIAATNLRTGEKQKYNLEDVVGAINYVIDTDKTDVVEAWQQLFNCEYPLNTECDRIAPVQFRRKETKVKVAKPVTKSNETITKTDKSTTKADEAEQIKGQDNILNHPEYLPQHKEQMNYKENIIDEKIKMCNSEFKEILEKATSEAEASNYSVAEVCLEKAKEIIGELKQIEESRENKS